MIESRKIVRLLELNAALSLGMQLATELMGELTPDYNTAG